MTARHAAPPATTPARRSRGRVVLAAVFVLLALNAWVQVARVPLGHSDEPLTLTAMHALIGLAAAAAGWGSWGGMRWAPAAAFLHGFISAVLLVALETILDLGPQARVGLWTGAALLLLFGAWSAWYLRRHTAGYDPPRMAESGFRSTGERSEP